MGQKLDLECSFFFFLVGFTGRGDGGGAGPLAPAEILLVQTGSFVQVWSVMVKIGFR